MKMQENNADFRVIFMIFSNLGLIMYRFLPLNHSLLKYICTTSKRKTKNIQKKVFKAKIQENSYFRSILAILGL